MNNHNSDQRKMSYHNRQDYHQPNQRQMSNYDQPVRNINNMHPNDHYGKPNPNDHYGKPMQRQYSANRGQPQYHQKMAQNRSNGPSMHHQQIRMQNQRYHSPNDNQYHQDDMAPLQEQYIQQDSGAQPPFNKHSVRYENQPYKNQNSVNPPRRESRDFDQFQDQQDRQDTRRIQPPTVRSKPVFNNEGQEIFEVYIHNVDFEVTANDVVNQFRHCGPIDHWKFPRKDATRQNHGRHKGYGFIFFKTIKGQINALNMRRNPPFIGNRHINISDNANQHQQQEDEQRFHPDDPYLNQNRPNLREQLPRQQDQFYGRFEPVDRFQRFDGPPRMMERVPDQRRNFDENLYQNNIDHYLPPRNMDHEDLRGEMVMQKYQSTRDFDRGRMNQSRQFLDEQSEEIQYIDRNPNLVVIKKSNDNFKDQQDQYPLNIQKKLDGDNEQNQKEQNWEAVEFNQFQEKEQNGESKFQPEQRQVLNQEDEDVQSNKDNQNNSNKQNIENQDQQEKEGQLDQEDKEIAPKIDEQSEIKQINQEDQTESKKPSPVNEDLKFDQTIESPRNENKQETIEDKPQVKQNNNEPINQKNDQEFTQNQNVESSQQNEVEAKANLKEQNPDEQKDVKQCEERQERIMEKREVYEEKEDRDQRDNKEYIQYREQKDLRDQRDRELHQYQYQQQKMEQMYQSDVREHRDQSDAREHRDYDKDENRMSKTDSYQVSRPTGERPTAENTNKYNPNNREFIGYKSDLLGRNTKDTPQDTHGSRDNRETRDNRDSRDTRSRGNDYVKQEPPRHNQERMMRGGHPRERFVGTDQRREDHRRVDNMHTANRGFRNDHSNRGGDHNNVRGKDDYYGRSSHNRGTNDRPHDSYTHSRNQKEMRGNGGTDEYGPGPQRGGDHRNNGDDRRYLNKRQFNQMDMDLQGFDPNKRQRRHEENEENNSIQQRQIDKRDSVDERQMDMMNDSRSMPKIDQNDRTKQYNDWKNQYNENRNIEGEYDSDTRYNQQNYRQRQIDDKSKDKRKYNNTSPERLNYEKQMNDDGHIDKKHNQYELNQALDLYGEDDNNYNIHEQQSSNQDHFDNYDEFENKSISFHEQLNEEKQKNKQNYRNK